MSCLNNSLPLQYVGEFPSPIPQQQWQPSPPAQLSTDDDALSALWAVLPELGRVPLSTLGILLGPGGWRRQFGRLGSLQAFIETHSEFFDIVKSGDTILVGRADASNIGIACHNEPELPVTAEELVETIRDLIPPTGMKVTQLGSTLGNWARKYAHLADKLQTFLEQNSNSFVLDTSVRPAVVFPASLESLALSADRRTMPTVEEAVNAILGAIPPGMWVPLPQLGSALGTGGWKAQFGHLGPMRAFLEMFPDLFMIDVSCKPPVVCRFDNSVPQVPMAQGTPQFGTESFPSAEMARDALLSILPNSTWVPLPQLGTALGFGGWKRQFGHLGALLPFLEANPIFFTVDYSQGETPLVRKGPDLEVLATVFPVNVPEVPLATQPPNLAPLPGARIATWPPEARMSSRRPQPLAPSPHPRATPHPRARFNYAETFVPAF